jgi:Lanthionine synthetase C-like protein
MTLWDPDQHEPLNDTPWDAGRARDAVRAIVADAERAFSLADFWPVHPRDVEPDDPPLHRLADLYLGAAGVIWALERLGSDDDWSAIAASLPRSYRAAPDFGEAMPSLMVGESGILLVAGTEPNRLLELVRTNATNPSNELFWGAPGTMLAAQVMWERTGAPEWAEAWNESADRVWAAWDDELPVQEMPGGRRDALLGAAHGLAGNVFALARGDLLDDGRRADLEGRTLALLVGHAQREDGLAQWPPSPGSTTKRTQWCHGAPGIVTSVAGIAPRNDELTELLGAGGETTWRAGPVRKGAGLCHGTAGNGYALLKLFERTGDELWLERARAFATHAIGQVRGGWHSLFTGDLGTALYVESCLDAKADFPTLDVF